jgi:hypothetical protein
VLHCAVEGGSIEIVTLCLSSSSEYSDKRTYNPSSLVNRLNKHSTSPICIAAAKLDVPLINVLLKHGADVSVGKWRGRCALAAVALKVSGGCIGCDCGGCGVWISDKTKKTRFKVKTPSYFIPP